MVEIGYELKRIFDYWMNTGETWDMNEVGLAVGNFAQSVIYLYNFS